MPNKLRQNDPIASHKRKSATRRRVGVGKHCTCGEARPEALIPGTEPIICASCKRKHKGQATTDRHHVAGKANDATTISVDVNDHRAELNVAQQDWEKPLLENPDGCPVVAVAARIRGFADTLIHLLKKLVEWVPQMLVTLSSFLKEELGSNWWVGTRLEPFAPRR